MCWDMGRGVVWNKGVGILEGVWSGVRVLGYWKGCGLE